jgi:dihydrofolate reductase
MIKTYTAVSLDGSVTDPEGRPVQLVLPTFNPSVSHGFPAFLADVTAVAMGRSTFTPALDAPQWPWGEKAVYVLTSSELPDETPEHVVRVEGGARQLADRLGEVEGDVHVVGGPTLIRGLWEIGAIDRLGLLVIPTLLRPVLPLFPLGDEPQPLELVASQAHPDGTLEVHYARRKD